MKNNIRQISLTKHMDINIHINTKHISGLDIPASQSEQALFHRRLDCSLPRQSYSSPVTPSPKQLHEHSKCSEEYVYGFPIASMY